MPFVLKNLILSPSQNEKALPGMVASRYALPEKELQQFCIVRKGIDARKKGRIKIIYTVMFSLTDEEHFRQIHQHDQSLEHVPEKTPEIIVPVQSSRRIIIAGMGPAGLFTALRLADYGLAACIIERGKPVETRARDVASFWSSGLLDPESNVQFGEGGAGTFSDGKLTCRTKDSRSFSILERLVTFGAPPEICWLAKPHIGTDRLRQVIAAIRGFLLERDFQIHFESCMTDIISLRGSVSGIVVNDAREYPCDLLVLATGHSARDTYRLLEKRGISLLPKPFAMGLRVEHPQELIDRIQYGTEHHASLPAAEYALTYNNQSAGRSAYSFCMSPGGVVIAGSSETGGVATNGMSGHLRTGSMANSALVVNVRESDFPEAGALGGIELQRIWEQKAFCLGGGRYRAPAQNLLDFLEGKSGKPVRSSYRPGVTPADLSTTVPDFITTTLREAIRQFDRKMRGFSTEEATLTGIESRTSAPVRIQRGEDFQSLSLRGLYPAGEGAGYAGGIMSSAIDGMRIADAIAGSLRIDA